MSTPTSPQGTLDVDAIRADFPILSRQVNGKPLVYLDNGASAQKPQVVIDTIREYYERDDCPPEERGKADVIIAKHRNGPTGEIKLQNEYLLARVEGSEQLMRFKYKLAGDHLLTMQPDGKIREFIRTPGNFSGQYPAQGYGW